MDDLAAELSDLWAGAVITLPRIADAYSQANLGIDATRRLEQRAFSREVYFPRNANDVLDERIDDASDYIGETGTPGYIEEDEPEIFDSPVTPNAQAMGMVWPYWVRLRNDLQTILGLTVNNLVETSAALGRAVLEYAATDEEAAARMNELNEERAELDPPPEGAIPPPVFPDDHN